MKREKIARLRHNCLSILIAFGFVALSACSSGGSDSDETEDTDVAGSASNLASLAAMRNETGVTKEYALAQFAAHFGELRSAPGYSADGSMPIFATHAVADVLQFIDEYEPAVRAEVYAKLFPPVASTANTPEDLLDTESRQVSRVYQFLANTIANGLEDKFGRALNSDVEVVRLPTASLVSDGSQGEPTIFTVPPANREIVVAQGILDMEEYELESTDSCWIVINEGTTSSDPFDNYTPELKLMTLAHEVTHCFQYEMRSQRLPTWISEGTASWVGVAYAGQTEFYDWAWKVYENAEYDLFDGYGYEAIGFWSHMANSFESENRDLWATLPAIFEASTGESAADLSVVIDQLGADGYASWPTGRAMKPEFGPEWDSIGVGGRAVPVVPRPTLEMKTAEYGEVKNLIITPNVTDPNSSGPVSDINVLPVLQISSSGQGAMHWSISDDPIEFGTSEVLNFCVIGNCVCANGQPPAGFENIQSWPENESLIIAMAGQANQLESTIERTYLNPLSQCPTEPVTTPVTGNENDSCLVGRWTLDKDFLANQPGNDGDINGDVFVDLRADGTGTTTFDLIIGDTEITDDEVATVITVTGEDRFNWNTSNGNYLVANKVSATEISVSIVTGGVSTPLPTITNDTSGEAYAGPDEGQAATYTCSENELIISVQGDDPYMVKYVK